MLEKTYLGDGVYAEFDGFQIWLEAESSFGMKIRIALDPNTFHALQQYAKKLAERKNDTQ